MGVEEEGMKPDSNYRTFLFVSQDKDTKLYIIFIHQDTAHVVGLRGTLDHDGQNIHLDEDENYLGKSSKKFFMDEMLTVKDKDIEFQKYLGRARVQYSKQNKYKKKSE